MKKSKRYDTSHLMEDQSEPGSRGRVLKNKLGITSKREMDRHEKSEQMRAVEKLTNIFGVDHRFTASDICEIHKLWLENIYEWAGEYRHVAISKSGFPFAFPAQIFRLMAEFEKGALHKYTPCRFKTLEEVIKAMAIVHTELVLIHPFRDGNGRGARMLATLMALQSGLPPLDFKNMVGKGKKDYIKAVQAGMDRNYQPMEKIFTVVIRKTLRDRGQK
ncbi:MAG: Fic/DOC family protein [Candidatus Anammoxibacter sp.]